MDPLFLKKYNGLPADQQQTVNDFVEFLYAKEREKSILRTVCGMGFKDGYEFAALRMFGISNNCKLEEEKTPIPTADVDRELEKMGLSMPAYLDKELLPYLKLKLSQYEGEVASYEQKYEMTWEEMDKNLVSFTQNETYDEFEMEDDYMNWVTYISFVESVQKTLTKHYDGADQGNTERV